MDSSRASQTKIASPPEPNRLSPSYGTRTETSEQTVAHLAHLKDSLLLLRGHQSEALRQGEPPLLLKLDSRPVCSLLSCVRVQLDLCHFLQLKSFSVSLHFD